MAFTLVVPRKFAEEMVAQAMAELPNECCGLLAGRIEPGEPPVGRVVERLPLVNALASPTEFESEPRGLFEAFKTMRRLGLDLLAIYHSHPTSDPVPSRKDRERNYGPEVVNLIVSLKGNVPEVRAWWLSANGFDPAEWLIEPAQNASEGSDRSPPPFAN